MEMTNEKRLEALVWGLIREVSPEARDLVSGAWRCGHNLGMREQEEITKRHLRAMLQRPCSEGETADYFREKVYHAIYNEEPPPTVKFHGQAISHKKPPSESDRPTNGLE